VLLGPEKILIDLRTDVSLICVSTFLYEILTIADEVTSLALWPQTQIEEYEFEMSQWRNPNASINYQTSPNVAIKVIFDIRKWSCGGEVDG
jgi:hypothetical protein